jgi:hypothetical protein
MAECSPLAGVLVVAVFWQRKGALCEGVLHAGPEGAVSRLGTGVGAGAFAGLSRRSRGIEAMGICYTAAHRFVLRLGDRLSQRSVLRPFAGLHPARERRRDTGEDDRLYL